jgi:hypothetical protein
VHQQYARDADQAAQQQDDVWQGGENEPHLALLRVLHVAAEVQPAADDEHEPERGGDQRVHVGAEEQDRGHEHHELLERVHLHAKVALEHLVAAGGGCGHGVGAARLADGHHEDKELQQCQRDHQVYQRHRVLSCSGGQNGTMHA